MMTVTSFNVPDLPFAEAAARQQQQAESQLVKQLEAEPVADDPSKWQPKGRYEPAVFAKRAPRQDTLLERGTKVSDLPPLPPEFAHRFS